MEIDLDTARILDRASHGEDLTRHDALELMEIDPRSNDMYALLATADRLARERFGNKGDCHAQIGLYVAPCPKECGFCTFASSARLFTRRVELSPEQVVARAVGFVEGGANAIYLMTTGDHDLERFLVTGRAVREAIGTSIPLVANIGDFGLSEATELGAAGFDGIYHAVRLGEGTDTGIDPLTRIATIEAARSAGLHVGYCVEPVGPEHSVEEIVDRIILGRDLGAVYSGAMKRFAVQGTALAARGEVPEIFIAKVVAVALLVMGELVKGNCTHEPNLLGLRGGANISWAETGPNPRDDVEETSEGRGSEVTRLKSMFLDAGYEPLEGPSPVFPRLP